MSEDVFVDIEEKELLIYDISLVDNQELYELFRSTILALHQCMNNSFQFIPNNDISNNYKLLNYLIAPKYISVAKNAMDMGLKGHPIESFNLTRLILEFSQISQYLTRHSENIAKYYAGKLKADEIRKKAEKEIPSNSSGRLFGLLSEFSYSTRDAILITLKEYENKVHNPIVIEDKTIIHYAVHGVTVNTWGHYFGYRCAFHENNIANEFVKEIDTTIFNVERIKHLFGNIQEESLKQFAEYILELDSI